MDFTWAASGVHMVLFSDVILKFREKIENLEKDIYAVLCLEREEREMQQSEAQVSNFFSTWCNIVHYEVTQSVLILLILEREERSNF